MKIQKDSYDDIISSYSSFEPMSSIAKRYGVSRQAIWYILRSMGAATNLQSVPVSCSFCHKEIMKDRSVVRRNSKNFCNIKCLNGFRKERKGNRVKREED